MARIRETVAKKLWYKAGGRCAFPHKIELSLPNTGQLFGRMAHIVARSSEGPRGDPSFTGSRLNEYENLILLCPDHHDEVDMNLSAWTKVRLRDLKEQHEDWVRRRLKWVEPFEDHQKRSKVLVILWGASSVGKDVVLNRILLRLQDRCPSMSLQRFTTRARRPEEADYTPFKHLTKQTFFERVARGDIACVHTANNTFYGFDSQFEAQAPPGTVILTCMRQFGYLDELNLRAEASGLSAYNVLLVSDYETVHNRTLARGTRDKEKTERMKTLKHDVDWFASKKESQLFDLVVENSDDSSLNSAVGLVYDFILQKVG